MPTETAPAPDNKAEPVIETPTGITGDIKSQTDAALKEVQGGGFDDPAFDAALQAAMDKDAGKVPEAPPEVPPKTQQPTPEAAAKAAELAAQQEELRRLQEAAGDIPPALLGEKPPETKPVDDATAAAERQKFIDEQTKGMTPKAAERFRKIENRAWEAEQKARKIEQEREATAASLKKQLAELEARAAEKKDIPAPDEALKKRLEELEELVSKTAISEDPRFKAKYDAPVEANLQKIKELAPADAADELAALAVMPKSKKVEERILELMDGLTDLQKRRIESVIVKIEETMAEKADRLKRWKEDKVHVEAEEIRKRETQQAELEVKRKVAWSNAMNALTSDNGLEVFRKLDGNDAWNAKVDARLAQVQQQLASELPPERVVEMAARSLAADEYRKMFLAQRVLVSKLSQELAALKQAQPDAGEDGGGAAGPVDDNRSFVDAAVEGTVKAGGLKP